MDKSTIVDLSNRIIPGKEHFPYESQVDDVTKIIPYVKHHPDDWYVVGIVKYCTHIGTHIEAPYHHKRGGMDIADFPFQNLIAPLVVMDFSKKKGREQISLSEVKAYDSKIHAGDVVLIYTGMDKLFHTDRWEENKPYVTPEVASYLVSKKVACVGTDTSDIEVPDLLTQPVHQTLFAADIPMIESAANLDRVKDGDYIIVILPAPFVGLDSTPCRIIAIPRKEFHWD